MLFLLLAMLLLVWMPCPKASLLFYLLALPDKPFLLKRLSAVQVKGFCLTGRGREWHPLSTLWDFPLPSPVVPCDTTMDNRIANAQISSNLIDQEVGGHTGASQPTLTTLPHWRKALHSCWGQTSTCS